MRSLEVLAAWSILIGLVLAVWVGVVGPLRSSWAELEDRRTAADAAAARFNAALSSAQNGEVEQLPKDAILTNPSSAAASADLQQRLNRIFAAAGGERAASTVLPSEDDDAGTTLAVRLDGEAHLEQIAQTLLQLETSLPLTFVERLELRPVQTTEDTPSGQLLIRLTVSAPFQPG